MIEEYKAAQFKQLVRRTYELWPPFGTSQKLSASSNFEKQWFTAIPEQPKSPSPLLLVADASGLVNITNCLKVGYKTNIKEWNKSWRGGLKLITWTMGVILQEGVSSLIIAFLEQ